MAIHPTAIVDSKAEIDPSVEIGPYSVVGPDVRLARDVVLAAHTHVTGHTEIGEGSQVFSFACIGEIPQDKKYSGERTRLVIGARNIFREYVTVHPGTSEGGGTTTLGDDNLMMIGMHIGHDCQLGSNIVISNHVQLAGHVLVEDHATISANSAILQFCRIGESSFLSGMAGLTQDLAPYTWGHGYPARVRRTNRLNLERRGFSSEKIEAVDRAFRIIFRSGKRPEEAFAEIRETLPDSAEAEHMVAFLEKSERGFARLR